MVTKVLLACWLALAFAYSCFGEDFFELQRLKQSRQEADASLAKCRSLLTKREKELAYRTTPVDAESLKEHQERIAELRMVVGSLEKWSLELAAKERKIISSHSYKTEQAIAADKRIPTKNDIGGVWTSGANMTGFTVQLNQEGTRISGHGYFWGCQGIYEHFAVTGTYRDEQLTLAFEGEGVSQWADGKPLHLNLRYVPFRKRPAFQGANGTRFSQLIPWESLRRKVTQP